MYNQKRFVMLKTNLITELTEVMSSIIIEKLYYMLFDFKFQLKWGMHVLELEGEVLVRVSV